MPLKGIKMIPVADLDSAYLSHLSDFHQDARLMLTAWLELGKLQVFLIFPRTLSCLRAMAKS